MINLFISYGIGYPKVNQDFICLLLGERRYELLSMIEQSDIIRAISLPNATLRGNWLFWDGECGTPRTNQDFVCLLWGEAEVRVAFNDRAERYHSRNLVTERDVTGELALLGGECGAPKSKPRFHLFTFGRAET